jgi:glycosyl transferase family 28
MIVIDAGKRDTSSFSARLHFARQLAARGHKAVLDAATAPGEMERSVKYEAIPFLAHFEDIELSSVLIIGAETIADEVLETLRRYQLDAGQKITAIGRFADPQTLIGTRSKLAYALGRDPDILDLGDLQPRPILTSAIAPLFASPIPASSSKDGINQLFVFVPKDLLEEPMTLPVLGVLSNTYGIGCHVITGASGKDLIRKSKFSAISTFAYSDLCPSMLAGMADIFAVFGTRLPGEPMAAFALDLMGRQGIVIDCTDEADIVGSGAPAFRGPVDLASLPAFLSGMILTNRDAMGRQTATSDWMKANTIERLEGAVGLAVPTPDPARSGARRRPRTIFIPTNGVGLGHAQRCSLVAGALPANATPGFAAFPSCLPMLQSKGFDCLPLVQKSEDHVDPYANDLLNYGRIRALLRPNDRLVFDGGYIFDSIYRTILEHQLFATWIRRGLWQPGQIGPASLEREKIFTQIIVPDEAFDELNANYSFGPRIHRVGPIVQTARPSARAIAGLRRRLQKLFDQPFEKLVVCMLGSGVAADRSAQLQSLCARFSSRPDCLHLIVVWPNAKISADLYGWENSHVVKTQNALQLCQAADFAVSAVGYNSFHEMLYHQIPAIFIPQMAGFTDDQERRARSASDRGLAATVLPHELLVLQREVNAFLEGGKAGEIKKQLKAVTLPETGTAAAARLINEGHPQ